jgi:hypothetical protein
MTRQELRRLLSAQSETEFTDGQLLGRCPWIFDASETYDAWRSSVAETLSIEPGSIRIVGSAATGFSLSPQKPGRPFRRTSSLNTVASDIDIALIHPNLFAMAWDTIIRFDREHKLGGTEERRNTIRVNVYWGLVGQRTLPRNTEPARMLLTAMSVAGRLPPLRGYRIQSRIYRRMEDLRAYHISSLRQLRLVLAAQEID